jgi:opacity protein-like surface antigen
MLRYAVFSLMILCCLQPAASEVKFGGGPQAGIAFWLTPDYEAGNQKLSLYGTGWTFGGHGDLIVMKYFTGRFSLDYTMFSSDKKAIENLLAQANPNAVASAIAVDGLNVSDFSIGLTGLGTLPTKSAFTPYALFGFGIHFVSISDPKVTYQGVDQGQVIPKVDSETDFGLQFGAGTEYRLKGVTLFLEVKYQLIFTKDKSTGIFPITIGATFP